MEVKIEPQIEKRCFTCLCQSEDCVQISSNAADSISSTTVLDVLTKHFWFQRDEFTNAEHVMCTNCWNRVEDFHRFYQEVEKNHRTLNGKSSEVCERTEDAIGIVQTHSEMEIKEEVVWMQSELEFEEDDLRLHSEMEIKEEIRRHQSDDVESESDESTDTASSSNERAIKSRSVSRRVRQKLSMGQNADEIIQTHVSYICSFCGNQFSTFNRLRAHMKGVHQQQAVVVCCGNRYVERCSLLEHVLNREDPNLFQCDICDSALANRRSFIRHKQEVHGAKQKETQKFQCDQCPKQFSRARMLRTHIRGHTDDKEYAELTTCPHCQKRYATIDGKKQHIRAKHDRERFVCDLCSKTFCKIDNLRRHTITQHTSTL